MKEGTSCEEILDFSNLTHWKNDSLYVADDDMNLFFDEYKNIFGRGIYGNLKMGEMDISAINYYPSNSIDSIIEKVKKAQSGDWKTLLSWLAEAKNYCGFYILGV